MGYSFHSALKKVWSKDLNISFSDEDWTRICKNCKVMSRNLGVWLIQFKILNAGYLDLFWRILPNAGGVRRRMETWCMLCPALKYKNFSLRFIIICCCPGIYVLGNPSFLSSDVEMTEWIQISIMIGRYIIMRGWSHQIYKRK